MSIITNIDKLRLKELEEKKTNTKSLMILKYILKIVGL